MFTYGSATALLPDLRGNICPMNTLKRLSLATLRLRRECEKTVPPFWTRGISGAEGEGGGADPAQNQGDPQAKITALEEEKDRHYRKAKEAADALTAQKKELEELQAKFKAIEDKDKTDGEKAKADLEAANAKIAELEGSKTSSEETVRDLQIKVAFLQSGKYGWHDPSTALKLVGDFGDITIEDGAVKGLDKAIEKMAKEKPFLVKTGAAGNGGQPGGGTTGQQPNGGSTQGGAGGQTDAQKRQELTSKYNIPR